MARRARNGRRPRGVRPVRILPLPEAVNGGKQWTIQESASAVPSADVTHRVMTIPTRDHPHDERIRLHEMAHARWSPANGVKLIRDAGLLHSTGNACEDARIHRKLIAAGFNLRGRAHSDELVEDLVERIGNGQLSVLDSAGLLMAAMETGEERFIESAMHGAGMGAVVAIVHDVYRANFSDRRPAFARTVDAATVLEEWFRDDPDPESLEGLTYLGDCDMDDDGERPGGAVRWGAMKVEDPAMPLRLPAKVRSRTRRSTPEGSVPRNWHRYCSDGAVFTQRTKRLPGGAVLIDQSGSMYLDAEGVLAIVMAAPAAIVATYAGQGDYGVLRILARDGRRVADEGVYLGMGDNTVDGPALEWLGAQVTPRYWVSDGMATSPAGNAIADAARIALRHRVVRVNSVDDLVDRLT